LSAFVDVYCPTAEAKPDILTVPIMPRNPVQVHSLAEACAALAGGEPVTLVSAPGAALYAGCGWWRALVDTARQRYPNVPCADVLDCADGTGFALAALRLGLCRLVLWPDAPGRDAVVAIAEAMGGFVLPASPTPATSRRRSNGDKSPSTG
jgi:hypothetical protein